MYSVFDAVFLSRLLAVQKSNILKNFYILKCMNDMRKYQLHFKDIM